MTAAGPLGRDGLQVHYSPPKHEAGDLRPAQEWPGDVGSSGEVANQGAWREPRGAVKQSGPQGRAHLRLTLGTAVGRRSEQRPDRALRPPAVCNTSTCHQSPPVCPLGQELISTQKEGDCCPTFRCGERGWGGTGAGLWVASYPGVGGAGWWGCWGTCSLPSVVGSAPFPSRTSAVFLQRHLLWGKGTAAGGCGPGT